MKLLRSVPIKLEEVLRPHNLEVYRRASKAGPPKIPIVNDSVCQRRIGLEDINVSAQG